MASQDITFKETDSITAIIKNAAQVFLCKPVEPQRFH